MGWIVVFILVVVLIVFGMTSSAQSYATAQHAQAQIEVARVAQINAWGNLAVILSILVIVVVILVLVVALVYLRIRVDAVKQKPVREPSDSPMLPSKSQMDMMLYAMMFRMLNAGQSPQPTNLIEALKEDDAIADPLSWWREG